MKKLSRIHSAVIIIILFVLYPINLISKKQIIPTNTDSPRMVIGIIVDQMRPDYIYRFWDKMGNDGFKRIIREGFSFTNTQYNYMPTSTGPGHASIYTGTTPSIHGIRGNNWYSRKLNRYINTVEVPGYKVIGVDFDNNVSKAPGNLKSTTIGDELRLHTNFRSKVIGISLKDRGAIMPAGHTGDAYWYDSSTGKFVTSSFYTNELPSWVNEFNKRGLPQTYLNRTWETLFPIESYTESMEDDNPYEGILSGKERPEFPYDYKALSESHKGFGLISSSPFGNEILTELAIAAIEGESLGGRTSTDLLSISFSSTDAIGHRHGPASKEIEDMYLRLDLCIARLLSYLDEKFGKEQILLFLTADHGVGHIPLYLQDLKIPSGYFEFENAPQIDSLRGYLVDKYGKDILLDFSMHNYEIFLDREYLDSHNLDYDKVQKDVARFIVSFDGIAGALTAETLINAEFLFGIKNKIQNGFNQELSGDVHFWLNPQWIPQRIGATHGTPWSYDTRVPLLWYGKGIPPGKSAELVNTIDIAPTIATFLNSPFPSGNSGNPLNKYISNEDN